MRTVRACFVLGGAILPFESCDARNRQLDFQLRSRFFHAENSTPLSWCHVAMVHQDLEHLDALTLSFWCNYFAATLKFSAWHVVASWSNSRSVRVSRSFPVLRHRLANKRRRLDATYITHYQNRICSAKWTRGNNIIIVVRCFFPINCKCRQPFLEHTYVRTCCMQIQFLGLLSFVSPFTTYLF